MSFIAKEAEHVEGFAKEMAVVTHHRLKNDGGKLVLDPEAKLEEPLIVRPTSETIIGDAFQRWVKSYRDLPLLHQPVGQRGALGDAHAAVPAHGGIPLAGRPHRACGPRRRDGRDAARCWKSIASSPKTVLAMPVIAGEKPENERFPGADNTYSIEAMMQDGKALQAGTSHYLGTHFAEAQNIQFQNQDGKLDLLPHDELGRLHAADRRRDHDATATTTACACRRRSRRARS